MAKAFVFPGQGAQFVGMDKDLYESRKSKNSFLAWQIWCSAIIILLTNSLRVK